VQSLVFPFQRKKTKLLDSLPEAIDGIELDDFIHGWMMFDPYHSFCNEAELS
jgi:hypothetical protein